MHDTIQKALALIQLDESQKDHLFQRLAKTSNPSPWLEPLFQNNFFDPSKNPLPEEDPLQKGFFKLPRWSVLGYLENVSLQNYRNPDDKITDRLVDIVDSIAAYKNSARERIDNYITDLTLVKVIFSLPCERIKKSHIGFIDSALKTKWSNTLLAVEIGKTAIPRLVEGIKKELLLQLINVILQYQKKRDDEYVSILDDYWLNEILTKNKPRIAQLCGVEAAEVGIQKMSVIIHESATAFNNIWIPTVEDSKEVHFRDRYEYQLIAFVRDMFVFSEGKNLKEAISHLIFSDEHVIFRRIALYVTNHHFKYLKGLFWRWEGHGNPLDDSLTKPELYGILHSNAASFSKEEIAKVLNWIETKDYETRFKKDEKETNVKAIAYRKKEWLSALIETKDPEVMASYKKYDEIAPGEVKHPGILFHMETSWGKAPTTDYIKYQRGLLEKTNNIEIATYLNDFKQVGNAWEGFSPDDLANTFRDCVKEYPDKFSKGLEPFLKALPIYQSALIGGLCEAWKNNKLFNWKEIFDFIYLLIESDSFWSQTGEGNNRRVYGIVTQIADLIIEGTKDDRHAFDSELLPTSEKILIAIAIKTKSDLPEMHDLVTSVLNSTQGRIFDAMMSHSLRYYRLIKNKSGVNWASSIKNDFTNRLNGTVERSVEFSLTLGKYLPALYYHLDKKWIGDNIDYIFPMDNTEHWEAAIKGYLFYSRSLYVELYSLLKKKGHYDKAFTSDFSDTHINERVVDHICVAYLNDLEKLEDTGSLISRLVNSKNIKQVSDLISFLWMLRNELDEAARVKIKPLWRGVHARLFASIDQLESQKAASDLLKWLSLADTIDGEIFEWLNVSVKYVEANYNSPFFIEYLLSHAKETPDLVGKIYLRMLASGIYPTYDHKNIRQLVETLYDRGQKVIADSIHNSYLGIGDGFLSDIYQKHNEDVN